MRRREPVDYDEDFQLLARWSEGEHEAANALFGRHYGEIRRYFAGRDPVAADDLTQRTFLACVEARARFEGSASFRTFLFAIARRQWLLFVRKGRRKAAAMRLRAADTPDLQVTPTGLINRWQEQQLLTVALNRLRPELQTVVRLYYWENMKGADIADALAIPSSTVRNRLARARQALRQRISETAPSDSIRTVIVGDLDAWTRSLVASGHTWEPCSLG